MRPLARGRRIVELWTEPLRNPLGTLPAQRRRTIARSVRAGTAVRDPDDAPYAVAYARWLQRIAARPLRLQLSTWHVALGAALLAYAIARGARRFTVEGALGAFAFYVLAPLAFSLVARRRSARAADAERLNSQLVDSFQLEPAPELVWRKPQLDPRRRALALSARASLGSFVALVFLPSLPAIDHRGDHKRLVLFGLLAGAALALALVALRYALRGLGVQGLGRKLGAVLLLVLALALTVGWAVGFVNVLFFGA